MSLEWLVGDSEKPKGNAFVYVRNDYENNYLIAILRINHPLTLLLSHDGRELIIRFVEKCPMYNIFVQFDEDDDSDFLLNFAKKTGYDLIDAGCESSSSVRFNQMDTENDEQFYTALVDAINENPVMHCMVSGIREYLENYISNAEYPYKTYVYDKKLTYGRINNSLLNSIIRQLYFSFNSPHMLN
jgi:hypothetical protein